MASEEEKADAAAAKECDDIHTAAENGNLAAVRHFVRSDPGSVHSKDKYGQTPLHFAAWKGQVAIAQLLLANGAALDAKNSFGQTPLHFAAWKGQAASAEFLLSNGAALDAKNSFGDTPLHLAVWSGQVASAEFLLSNGAKVDAKSNDGETPLHKAAANGQVACAQLLLSNGAAVDATNNDGETPLDLARNSSFSGPQMVKLLQNWREAKKASADDSKTPSDLGKGKAEMEPRPTDEHAAGSGAVAVKHQRASSKEAAKELQEAMASSDVQVSKKAIDNAKLHKVSPEDVMKGLEKYIALQEAVAASPGPTNSGHGADKTSEAGKKVSKDMAQAIESLPDGGEQKHVMLSGRFNRPEIIKYIRTVKSFLEEAGIKTYMVECQTGDDFAEETMLGLHHAKAMVVFGTAEYGAKTGAGYETYYELKYAHQKKLPLIPLQLCEKWPPQPTENDERGLRKAQNDFVLNSTKIRLSDKKMENPKEMAEGVASAVRAL